MIGGKVFNTDEKKPSQFITYGVQELIITGFSIKTASTGSKQILFNVEGPCAEPGFVAHQDAKFGGRIGRIEFTSYLKDGSPEVDNFLKDLQVIAEKLGVKEQVASITANTLEEYMPLVMAHIGGKSLILAVTAKEYLNNEGKIRFTLGRRRFGFAASLAEGVNHLKPFDKSNEYDYKPIQQPTANAGEVVPGLVTQKDDLPF